MEELWNNGFSVSAISKRVGFTWNTVRAKLRERGYEIDNTTGGGAINPDATPMKAESPPPPPDEDGNSDAKALQPPPNPEQDLQDKGDGNKPEPQTRSPRVTQVASIDLANAIIVQPRTMRISSQLLWQAQKVAQVAWAWPEMTTEDFLDTYLYYSFKKFGVLLGGVVIVNTQVPTQEIRELEAPANGQYEEESEESESPDVAEKEE